MSFWHKMDTMTVIPISIVLQVGVIEKTSQYALVLNNLQKR